MKKISLAILTLLVALTACKKVPEVNLKYVDVERDLITVGTTTATVQCDYQYIATLKKAYLYYGEGENEADMNAAEMRVVQNTLYVDLAGLEENTTYSYYYEFHNGFNSMRTVAKTFKTESSGTSISLPTVVTAEVTEITTSSAKSGGEVTNNGGAEVTERGICWGTNANPSLSDNHVAAGAGLGAFNAAMSGLEANTTYHVRAYATNSAGTAYGLDREFVTVGGSGNDVPEGAINGLFSVSPTRKVYISQGNLQYQASTNTWRFADNQWDYVGDFENGSVFENGIKCDNSLISSFYNGWIDLFGWGTSGWDNGNIYYMPYDYQSQNINGQGYGPTDGVHYDFDLVGAYSNADWGVNNAISNGGNQAGLWRTLNINEWVYLIDERNTDSGIRYAMAQVSGVKGVILLPDQWDANVYHLNSTNPSMGSYSDNILTNNQWAVLENAGAVFLPGSGMRFDRFVDQAGGWGEYYSISYCDSIQVHSLHFGEHRSPEVGYGYMYSGFSVRLVQDATPQPSITIPNVVTPWISHITANSAICCGDVTYDGGDEVTERGICWSTNANPSLNDNYIVAGSGTGAFTAAMSGLEANTTYHVRAYATNSAGTAYGLDKEFVTISNGGSGGDHEWVDLGLPSGTLWATCNVGADTPEGYGDYFAWGETQPKDYYGWDNYQYSIGDGFLLTKYCNVASYGYNGFTDDLITLLPEDDAATANWGNEWRMPTIAERTELYQNTTNTWTTQNGVNGCLFTASNGSSLFLPAAGGRWGDELSNAGSYGYYWSSSLYTGYPPDAEGYYFNSGICALYNNIRACGWSVRAVRSAPQN